MMHPAKRRGDYRQTKWQRKSTVDCLDQSATPGDDVTKIDMLEVPKNIDVAHASSIFLKQESVPQNDSSVGSQQIDEFVISSKTFEVQNSAVEVVDVQIPSIEVENVSVEAAINQEYRAAVTPPKESVHCFSNLSIDTEKENPKTAIHTYTIAKIKAAFYPKFDNENSDKENRMRMIEMVSKGKATLEVSLKHSGFLFIYAGQKGGAYAENSFGNTFTAIGIFILGRLFSESWGTECRKKQDEFNCYLETNQICISMEVVTAVVGDNGQRPKEDYGVVTAITELGSGKPKFFSFPDIYSFCQRWRLPTNYVWFFSTRKSVTTFFSAFYALCEEGTAISVFNVLDGVADLSIPGSKDYMKVQGDILKGLLVHTVHYETILHMENILRDFRPMLLEGVDMDHGPSLREICVENESDKMQMIRKLLCVGESLCGDFSDWIETEPSDEYTIKADQSSISKFLEAHPSDFCTSKLQEMISLMKENNYPFKLLCYRNFSKMLSLSGDKHYFKMTFSAYNNSSLRGYQQEMRRKPGLWPLYQGLFVDINFIKADNDNTVVCVEDCSLSDQIFNNGSDASKNGGLADEDVFMMMKLKFLPYRLRTSLIRNGLPVLFKDGRAAYRAYYQRKMKAWGTSSAMQWAISDMLNEWSSHIQKKYVHQQLSPTLYLSEAEPFLELYAKHIQKNPTFIATCGNLLASDAINAILDDGAQVEHAIRTDEIDGLEKIVKQQELESASTHLSRNDVSENGCLIIFFPGIPGSSKSGLCREINLIDGLGDYHRVRCIMGDHVKGMGKNYWQELANECRREPHSIILADKNAPNKEAWRHIEKICIDTKSSAVPVVPDSKGTYSNPYCLEALAVSMFRVLEREYHTGYLDIDSPNAGYVVLKFYSLHDGKNRKEFERELVQRFGSIVTTPLLKSERSPMPKSILSVLEEGIQLSILHEKKHPDLDSLKGSYSRLWIMWEKKLRNIIIGNSTYFNYAMVPFDDMVKKVLEQLTSIVTGEHKALNTELRMFTSIASASVNISTGDVNNLLDNIAKNNPKLEAFVRDNHMKRKSLKNTCVALAHKRSHGVIALAKYGPLIHQKVTVDVTALLFSENVAALEVELGSIEGEKVCSKYEWPHLALWCGEKGANMLPRLVSEDKATREDIRPPVSMLGTLEFC